MVSRGILIFELSQKTGPSAPVRPMELPGVFRTWIEPAVAQKDFQSILSGAKPLRHLPAQIEERLAVIRERRFQQMVVNPLSVNGKFDKSTCGDAP